MSYTNQLIDYILETEIDSFWDCIEEELDWLSDDDRNTLLAQSISDKDYKLDIQIMEKLVTKHIYAIAYLASEGVTK